MPNRFVLNKYQIDIQPIATGAAAAFPYDERIAKNFWLSTQFDPVPLPLFRRVMWSSPQGMRDVLLLPRTLAPVGVDDRRTEGRVCAFNSSFVPRNKEQSRIITEADALLSDEQSFIIEAPTGIGKTWMSMELIARVGRRTLVIVTKEDIKTQWIAAAKAVLGLQDSDIGIVQGDKCQTQGKKLVIGMVQSLSKMNRYPRSLFRGFGFLIVDECHRMGADKFSQAMWQQPAKLRMGLSATPYRKDGKDVVFHAHIGPVRVKSRAIPLIPQAIQLKSTWRLPWVSWGGKHQPLPHTPGRLGKVNKSLAEDAVRNSYIAQWVKACYDKGRTTIVFSALKESHLGPIETALIQLGIKRTEIGWYVGGLKEEERYIAGRKPIVLATYTMASEATDLPWLDTCILTTPRSDVTQIVGRILRPYPEKHQPLVLDVCDDDSTILLNFGRKRKQWYSSIGATVKSGTLKQKWMDKTSKDES